MSMKEDLETVLTEWKKLGADIKQKKDHWTLYFENDKAKVYIEEDDEEGKEFLTIETNQFEDNIYNENLGYELYNYKNLEYELIKVLVRSINKHKMSEEWNNILHKYKDLVRSPKELMSKITYGCLAMNKDGTWCWYRCGVENLVRRYEEWDITYEDPSNEYDEDDDSDDEYESDTDVVELEYLDWNYDWRTSIDCNKQKATVKDEINTLKVLEDYAKISDDLEDEIDDLEQFYEKYGDMSQEERDLYNMLEKHKNLKVSQKTKDLMKTFL